MSRSSILTNKSFLLTCDDNYMVGLIATLNSILKNFPNAKIYLVHTLSKKNLEHVKKYIYKEEHLNTKLWKHLPSRGGCDGKYVTKANQGKYQADFIEEEQFFYIDCDAIITRPFKWETPQTMSTDIRVEHTAPGTFHYAELKLLREFILKNSGLVEKDGGISLIFDGAFFANRDWLINVFRPKIIECSKKYQGTPQTWYGLEYSNAANGLLKRPVKPWNLKQSFSMLESQKKTNPKEVTLDLIEGGLSTYDIIHYIVDKPWKYAQGKYPFYYGEIWWDYYLNGPIKPIEMDPSK